jgi:hypothetical protein
MFFLQKLNYAAEFHRFGTPSSHRDCSRRGA